MLLLCRVVWRCAQAPKHPEPCSTPTLTLCAFMQVPQLRVFLAVFPSCRTLRACPARISEAKDFPNYSANNLRWAPVCLTVRENKSAVSQKQRCGNDAGERE